MRQPLLKNRTEFDLFKKSTFAIPAENFFSTTEMEYERTESKTVPMTITERLEKKWNHHAKRTIDLLLSTLLILTVFPWLLPLLSIFIKLDSNGPVFFVQCRNKRDGGVFRCIKFRSMQVNTEAHCLPASKNDDRITRVGRFLRRHHLDELPQLFNVWLGDMSIVGPRPHMLSDNIRFETLVPYYHHRHKVKPGITGLAQVLGYIGPVTTIENIKARVENDIYYVYNWSLSLDTKIAFRTLMKIAGWK
jgi:putative colanic acid biosynthesis UDP-glucose lipid carrier transferase